MDAGVESGVDGSVRTVPLYRWCMAVTLMGFSLADVYVTQAIRRAGGTETNPVMVGLISDPSSQLLVKTLVTLAVCVLLIAVRTTSVAFVRGVGLVIALYVVVMGWNLGVLLAAVPQGAG